MADEVAGNTQHGREEEAEEQEIALLSKARDSLYLTMDRTRGNKHHVSYMGREGSREEEVGRGEGRMREEGGMRRDVGRSMR